MQDLLGPSRLREIVLLRITYGTQTHRRDRTPYHAAFAGGKKGKIIILTNTWGTELTLFFPNFKSAHWQ